MNFLKRLFKKKNYNIGIIRFGDNIVIPGRDYFEDENKIKLLELYKKHYIEELCKRKAVTTLNFNSNTLKQDMKMNIDLILRVLLDNEDFYLLAPEELIIQSLKLRMYYEEINALEEETILRLIALKEIEKSKKVPRHNRMALEEEINQLSIILEMYSYRKSAINIELKNYFDVLSTKDLEKQDTEIFKQRLDKLLFITDGIIDKKEIDKYEDIKIKIAILERLCERYAYRNRNEAEKIKNKLYHERGFLYNFNMSYTIIELEKKLLLFYEYGDETITKDDIKTLYNIKFENLTKSIIYDKKSPIKSSDYGLPFYKSIIADKIENIISLKNINFNLEFKENLTKSLSIFRRCITNELNTVDYEETLLDIFKLKLVLVFSENIGDHNDNFLTLMKNTTFEMIKNIYKDDSLKWKDDAKLINVFKLVSEFNPLYNHPWYELFSLNYNLDTLEENKPINGYYLPSGLRSIDFTSMYRDIYDKLKIKCNNTNVYLPEIMTEMYYGNKDVGCNCKGLYIHTFLEKLSDSQHNENSINFFDYIYLVDEIYRASICKIDKIIFVDFKNSKILQNTSSVKDLFYYIAVEEVSTYIDDPILSEHKYIVYYHLKFDEIELIDENGIKYQILKSDIEDKCNSIKFDKNDYYAIYRLAISNLYELIKLRTGYEFYYDTKEFTRFHKNKSKKISLNN